MRYLWVSVRGDAGKVDALGGGGVGEVAGKGGRGVWRGLGVGAGGEDGGDLECGLRSRRACSSTTIPVASAWREACGARRCERVVRGADRSLDYAIARWCACVLQVEMTDSLEDRADAGWRGFSVLGLQPSQVWVTGQRTRRKAAAPGYGSAGLQPEERRQAVGRGLWRALAGLRNAGSTPLRSTMTRRVGDASAGADEFCLSGVRCWRPGPRRW